MRRFPLPPSGMWPCERPIVHVLNGDYPAAELRRMSVPRLERLVAKLVQRTSKSATKPQWWPRELVFTHPIDLGLSSEREIKFAFKQLIVSCCKFFKANEGRSPSVTSKDQFLRGLCLRPRHCTGPERVAPPPVLAPAKFSTCVHIPFSSDVGRIMAAREQHGMSDELKMRRLERSEWYTNRTPPRPTGTYYEVGPYKEPLHSHIFRMPKRQQHYKRRSLRNVKFLARFCTPISVLVPRLDLDKVKSDRKRELVVMIRDTDKICCDLRRDFNTIRTSLRPRNV